jgi:hypothetical protein
VRHEDEFATNLRVSLALARDAGEDAASRFRQIATGNTDPGDIDGVVLRDLGGGRWRKRGPTVTGGQVRAAAASLDEFAHAVMAVDRLLDAQGAPGNLMTRLADTPDGGGGSPADVYERVNDTLAELERIRVALVLERPITRPRG